MAKNKKPHKAQLAISIMVYDLLADGSMNSTPMTPKEMSDLGVKNKYLVEINGFDRFETIKKLKGVLDELGAK